MRLSITGIPRLRREVQEVFDNELPKIMGDEYKEMIIENLEPSKKTGALSRSWDVRTGRNKAIISSDLPYAYIQNYGGKITITESMRSKMWALYYETGIEMYKFIALARKPFVKIPAKRFIKLDNREYESRLEEKLNQLLARI